MISGTAINHPTTSGWLKSKQSDLPSSLAKDAFERAVSLIKTSFTDEECEQIRLCDNDGIGSILQAVREAKIRYEDRKQSKVRKWLASLSARVLLYGQVFDIVAQHHPEYVALAWGAMKFVFIGVMHHEELIKELAKALCQIADALPQADLKVFLYPTDSMRQLVATLYIQMITFIQRAVMWYKESKIKHIITAITRPYTLHFKDLAEEIAETSVKIDRLALSMAMAELRETRVELQEARVEQRSTHNVVLEIRNAMEERHALQLSSLLDTSKRVCEVQFSQILSFIAMSPLASPELSRQFYCARRNRRRRCDGSSMDIAFLRNTTQLQEWASDRHSSIIAVHGSFSTRHTIRDFAADVIDSISATNTPVVWELNTRENSSAEHTPSDVLKHMVSQILQQNHTLLNERSAALNAARFQSAVTEKEWFNLVGSALEGLQVVYFIIDLEVLAHATPTDISWSEAFLELFDELTARNIRTIVKLAFVSSRSSQSNHLSGCERRNILEVPRGRTGRVTKQIPFSQGRKERHRLSSIFKRIEM